MIISYSISECHDKMANLLTSILLELKELNLKKGKNFLYQISDKTTSKKAFLVRFVATNDVHLDEI